MLVKILLFSRGVRIIAKNPKKKTDLLSVVEIVHRKCEKLHAVWEVFEACMIWGNKCVCVCVIGNGCYRHLPGV